MRRPHPTAGNTGELIVSPGRIDFADTSVGDGTAADLVVQNQRTVETTIDVISIEGSHEGSFSIMPNSIIKVGPQRSVKLTVRFTPKERKDYRAEIVMFHNAPNLEPLRDNVTGKGAACLDLDQDGFGMIVFPVQIATMTTQTFVLALPKFVTVSITIATATAMKASTRRRTIVMRTQTA